MSAQKELQTYKVEFTDTYSGEANFCWIERRLVKATSIKQAITKAKRDRYHAPIPRHVYVFNDSDMSRIDIKGACVCAFIEWIDEPEADEYRTNYSNVIELD